MSDKNTYIGEMLLNAETISDKVEILYQLQKVMKKRGEYFRFDKSTIFKTEIARMFCEFYNVSKERSNLIITETLVCNCKRRDTARDPESLKADVAQSTAFLSSIGFCDTFCYDCEQINRYSKTDPRSENGDILELVEQMGGLLLDREERKGYSPEESLVLIEERNLKANGYTNRYLEKFKDFIRSIEKVTI